MSAGMNTGPSDTVRTVIDLDPDGGHVAVLDRAAAALAREVRRRPRPPATLSAPTAAGHWLTFASTDLGAGGVAVVVDPIRPSRFADVVARARGLSTREQEVLAELARGRSNKQIARALHLSEWTVQDHVKAVLAKFAVSGRSELQAALFSVHYAPLHR